MQAPRIHLPASTAGRVLLGLALFALPLWIGTIGASHRVWLDGTLNLATGDTLYELAPVFGTNPNTTRYVYLPVFAYANGALITLPLVVHILLGGTAAEFESGIGIFATAAWGYIGYLVCAGAAGVIFDADDSRRWVGIALVAALPLAVVASMYRGGDLLVAALLLGAMALLQRDRSLDAGVAVSLATFKFTAIPSAGILTLWVLVRLSSAASTRFVLGGGVAQLPNAWYFLQHPADFWFIVRQRGALSTYAYQFKPTDTFLLPVQWLNIEGPYVDVIFPLVVIASILVGAAIALDQSVLGGVMVGYFAMSMLVPAESRILPFVICLLVLLLWIERWWGIPAAVGVIGLSAYHFLLAPGFNENVDTFVPLWGITHHLFLLASVVLFGAALLACRTAPRMVAP